MSEYNNLLEELRSKIIELQKPIIATAKEYIPKMYLAIRKECPEITPIEARQRIEKDCKEELWSKRTIIAALPDEAKNLIKQKAGRLRYKNKNSAAIIAAPIQHQTDDKGKIVQENKHLHLKVLDHNDLTNDLIGFKYKGNRDNNSSNYSLNKQLLDFEFCLKFKNIREYVAPLFKIIGDNGDIWFNGKINIYSGKVVEANFGRIKENK